MILTDRRVASIPMLHPDDLARQLKNLPASLEVLPRLMTLLRDDDTSLDTVAALISMDQGLAARVLSLSNSSYYGGGERSYSIQDAVSRVGSIKVFELVSHAAGSQLLLPMRTYGMEAVDVWRKSLSCAIAADLLGRRLGIEGQAAYALGLLQLSGLVALDMWNAAQPNPVRLTCGQWPDESTAAETATFGFDNAAVAAALMQRWRFSPALAEAQGLQYQPLQAEPGGLALTCVLHMAKWLRDAAYRPERQPPPPLPAEEVLSIIRVERSEIDLMRMEVRGDCENAMQLLADIGDPNGPN